MDCRKYIGKHLDTKKLETYDYMFEAASKEHYRDHSTYFVTIQKKQETPDDPSYSLLIQTNEFNKITHIERLKTVWECGSRIKHFPEDVDALAEKSLLDLSF